MAMKKQTTKEPTQKQGDPAESAATSASKSRHHEEYDQAVSEFSRALELFYKGELSEAKAMFENIAAAYPDEPVLTERARSYATICSRKVEPAIAEPVAPEQFYYKAVFLLNNGESDAAIELLDRALQSAPSSAKLLFARASAYAIKGNTEQAVSALRQAIAADPQIRFQATNDPDFEQIREEPAFIDIIEPTPSGE